MGKIKILKLGLIVGLLSSLVFIVGCATAGENGGEGEFDWSFIVILVAIFAVFYFLLIRPQQKKQKEHKQLTEELQRGDRVITAGGIHGQIESISEDSVVLKVESGTTIRVTKSSVAGKQVR